MAKSILHQWQRAREQFRNGGLRHTLEVACAYQRIAPWLYHDRRTHLLRLETTATALTFRPRPEYDYFQAGPAHIEELAGIDGQADRPATVKLFRQFLDDGAICYGIAHRGRIVAYNWLFDARYTVTHDGYQERQFHLDLHAGESVFGNGYIAPEYRMKGLFPLLVTGAIRDRPDNHRLFTTIERLNDNSLRAHRRIGFDVVGTIACHRLCGSPYFWSWVSAAAGSRFLGFGQPEVALHHLVGQDA